MHGWDHLHTQDCLFIGGVKVPLTKSRSETQQAHQLHALSSVTLGPRSAAVVKVLASLAHFMKTGEQEALWEGEGIGTTDELAHAVTAEAAVITLEKGRVASVLVRNPFDLPVQVDKGRQLGRVNVADGAAIHVIDQNNEGPYTCAEKKEEYIQQFVQAGKRGKDESPPLVPADLKGRDKKKGGKIRWCIDWRRLNEITKKDTFPMPLSFSSLSSLLRDSVSTIYR